MVRSGLFLFVRLRLFLFVRLRLFCFVLLRLFLFVLLCFLFCPFVRVFCVRLRLFLLSCCVFFVLMMRVRDHRSDTICGQSFDHHRSGGAAAEGRCPACINQWRLSAMVQILSKYASKVISDVHGHFLEKCLPIILLLSDNVSAISACVRKYAEAMF